MPSRLGWPIRALQKEGLLVSRDCSFRLRVCPILARKSPFWFFRAKWLTGEDDFSIGVSYLFPRNCSILLVSELLPNSDAKDLKDGNDLNVKKYDADGKAAKKHLV